MEYPIGESDFAMRVRWEVERARFKHAPMRNLHEAYAVLLEEVDEFWDEVKKQSADPAAAYKELVQIGAMAQRAAEDLGLPRYTPADRMLASSGPFREDGR